MNTGMMQRQRGGTRCIRAVALVVGKAPGVLSGALLLERYQGDQCPWFLRPHAIPFLPGAGDDAAERPLSGQSTLSPLAQFSEAHSGCKFV